MVDFTFLDNCPEACVYVHLLLDEKGNPYDFELLFFNKSFLSLEKIDKSIIGKKYYSDFFPNDERDLLKSLYIACYESKSLSIVKYISNKKSNYSFSFVPVAIGYCVVFLRDEKPLYELAKRDAQIERDFLIYDFQVAFKSGVWRVDFGVDGSLVSIKLSEESRRMMGLDERNDGFRIIDKWAERVHPNDKNEDFVDFFGIFGAENLKSEYDLKYRYLSDDGSYRWMRENGKVSFYDDGKPKFYIGLIVDINDSIELEKEQEEIRDINKIMSFARWNVVYDGNENPVEIYWSDELRKIFGIEDLNKYPATFSTWKKLVYPSEFKYGAALFFECKSDVSCKKDYDAEYRVLCSDGTYKWIHIGAVFHRDANGILKYCNGIIEDIDDKYKKLDKEKELEFANSELENLLTREIQNNEIVGSLRQLFFSMYYIDLEEGTFREIIADSYSHNILGKVGDASETMKNAVSMNINPEFHKTMNDFNNLSTLDERLIGKTSISEECISVAGLWIRSVIIVAERNEIGKVTKVLYVLQNIDAEKDALRRERKEALEEASRLNEGLRILLETIGSAQWTMKFNDKYEITEIKWSDEVRRILGYNSLEDFPDTVDSFKNIIYEDDLGMVGALFNAAQRDLTGETLFDIQYRVKTKNASIKWFHAAGRFIRNTEGMPLSFYGIFTDIDNQVKLQEQIEEHRKSLNDALIQAQNANNAKTSFLSRMSHDIRTPLNGILGLIESDEKYENDFERIKVNREKAKIAAKHLLSLVNDVLDMSKLEDGVTVLAHEAFDLNVLGNEVMTIVMPKANEAGISIQIKGFENVENPHFVYGSPLHVRQIFLNIIGNSIKYNKPNGSISIYVFCMGIKNGYVTYKYEISDTGIGMSKNFLNHIFEPFAQEKIDARSVYNGTGLGMAIVKSLIDKMNGTIEVTSTKNVGSKFVLTIPFEIADEKEIALALEKDCVKSIEGVKILVAEDNELNMEIIQTLLGDEGAIITPTVNGREAVDVFESNKEGSFDIILMDLMMPVLDGLSATRLIRDLNRKDASSIPIVAMTANAFSEDVQNCMEAGMTDHLAKPLEIEKVIQTISRLVFQDR